MKTDISILCDNSISRPGFIGEHGFSALIERGDEKFLFDTGPGLSLPLNLKTLGKDLTGLSGVILSHGHNDHTGGLKWVLEQTGGIEVIGHPGLFAQHRVFDSEDRTHAPRNIACAHSREELSGLGAVFRFISHTTELVPGLWFIAGIHMDPEQTAHDPRLVLPEGDGWIPDPVDDDASLLLETDDSPVLILGCAHSGVLNILDHVRKEMGITRLRAVLGGTHLMFYGPENVSHTISKLEEFSIDRIGVSHCTGMKAVIRLASHFGDRFTVASAGSTFTF